MRWIRSRPKAGTELPPDVPTTTLAGASAYGETRGSGAVAPWNQLAPYDGGAQLVPSLPGRELVSGVPYLPDMPPDSLYADRPMRGGVQTLSAFGEYQDGPAFTGAFRVLANRPPLVMVEGGAMEAQSYVEPAEWREPPAVTDLCRTVRAPEPAGGMTGLPAVS